MMAGPRDLALCLSDYLTDEWTAAFHATPRHLFIPDRALMSVNGHKVLIDRDADPDAWIDAAYQDAAIITQFDDGASHGPGQHTSSCSMPQVVLSMLTALETKPGQRVLEIGTGTGYSVALLAHRLGSQNGASMEIDPGIAEQAHANLAKVNRAVTVITGDGVHGYPSCAPYDRKKIISNADCEFTVGLFLTNVQYSIARDDAHPDTYELLLYDVATKSAATVQVTPEHINRAFPVRQHGPRQLWHEAETAYTWWTEHGRPTRTRYGITITPHTQTVWLDQPNNTVALKQ